MTLSIMSTATMKLLYQGSLDAALTEARDALRVATEIHGVGSAQLIPSYTLLAEVYIKAGRLDRAELSLSHAKWSSIKDNCTGSTTASLHRSYGLLCAAKKTKDTEALRQFANYAYHLSLMHGPQSIHTTPAYYHLAEVLRRSNEDGMSKSFAAYTKIVQIWREYFADEDTRESNAMLEGSEADAEALPMLYTIYNILEQDRKHSANGNSSNNSPQDIEMLQGHASMIIARLENIGGNLAQAKTQADRAISHFSNNISIATDDIVKAKRFLKHQINS